MAADTQTRVLFFVTTPISESIDYILYWIAHQMTRDAGPNQAINWHDTASPNTSIPTIEPHLSFTRHFALGAMDRTVWEDPHLTNMQRFRRASFWEHRGSTRQPRRGKDWEEEEIGKIEAIQFLGWTEKSDDLITNEYASVLLQGWGYLPVWWNCQSFATRLAFLVVELETFRDRVASLAHLLHTQLVQWVISYRDSVAEKTWESMSLGFAGCWTGAVVSIFVFPPAGVFFVMGGMGCGLAGMAAAGVNDLIYKEIDKKRHRRFQVNLEQLQTRFPSLRGLHAYLDQPRSATGVR